MSKFNDVFLFLMAASNFYVILEYVYPAIREQVKDDRYALFNKDFWEIANFFV